MKKKKFYNKQKSMAPGSNKYFTDLISSIAIDKKMLYFIYVAKLFIQN